MEYKAVIFDLDGTAVANSADALPSEKVVNAVAKAKDKAFICAATGRTISYARQVLQALRLSSPCIISGGTQIVDPKTEKVLWEKKIELKAIKHVLEIFKTSPFRISFSDEHEFYPAKNANTNQSEYIVYIMDIPKERGNEMLHLLDKVKGIKAYMVRAYKPSDVELHITSNLATKQQAISKLLEILDIKKDSLIGIGDSNNDIPLLLAVGLKVAMGNATDEVKQVADYIAPDVSHDGVADVIKKFILKTET